MYYYYVDFSKIAKKNETEINTIKDFIGFDKEKFKDFMYLNFIKIENKKISTYSKTI